MKFSNSIELEIRGERALFRDPLRPQTLPVPSCEALKGILGSIYRLHLLESGFYLGTGQSSRDGTHRIYPRGRADI